MIETYKEIDLKKRWKWGEETVRKVLSKPFIWEVVGVNDCGSSEDQLFRREWTDSRKFSSFNVATNNNCKYNPV